MMQISWQSVSGVCIRNVRDSQRQEDLWTEKIKEGAELADINTTDFSAMSDLHQVYEKTAFLYFYFHSAATHNV